MREKCKGGHASALYLHRVQMQLVLEIWVWMGLVLFPGTFPITVHGELSGSDLPHKSYPLSTECPYVYESDYSIHNTTERTLAHVHWGWSNRIFLYVALKVLLVLWGIWSLDFFRCYSTILCKQQHQGCSCTYTWVSSGILPHCAHFIHVCIKLHNYNLEQLSDYGIHFTYFLFTWGEDGNPQHQ